MCSLLTLLTLYLFSRSVHLPSSKQRRRPLSSDGGQKQRAWPDLCNCKVHQRSPRHRRNTPLALTHALLSLSRPCTENRKVARGRKEEKARLSHFCKSPPPPSPYHQDHHQRVHHLQAPMIMASVSQPAAPAAGKSFLIFFAMLGSEIPLHTPKCGGVNCFC